MSEPGHWLVLLGHEIQSQKDPQICGSWLKTLSVCVPIIRSMFVQHTD